MIATKTPRLLAAAKEFNIGKETLISFLSEKGFEINASNPNTKLTEKMYDALCAEFPCDKIVKEVKEVSSSNVITMEISDIRGWSEALFATLFLSEEEILKQRRERAREIIKSRYSHLLGLGDFGEQYLEYLVDEYLRLELTTVRSYGNVTKLLTRSALFFLGKIKTGIIRNLRFFHRTLVRFLFKNMDDNSGNSNFYQLATGKNYKALNYQLCIQTKKNNYLKT